MTIGNVCVALPTRSHGTVLNVSINTNANQQLLIWTRLFQSREANSNSQALLASSCLPEQTAVISQHLSAANLHTLGEIPHWDRASEHRAWPGGSFWRKCSEFCEEKKQSHSSRPWGAHSSQYHLTPAESASHGCCHGGQLFDKFPDSWNSYYRRFPLIFSTFNAESCCLIPLKSRSRGQQTRQEILVIKSSAVFADLIFTGLGRKKQARSEHKEMKIQSNLSANKRCALSASSGPLGLWWM